MNCMHLSKCVAFITLSEMTSPKKAMAEFRDVRSLI